MGHLNCHMDQEHVCLKLSRDRRTRAENGHVSCGFAECRKAREALLACPGSTGFTPAGLDCLPGCCPHCPWVLSCVLSCFFPRGLTFPSWPSRTAVTSQRGQRVQHWAPRDHLGPVFREAMRVFQPGEAPPPLPGPFPSSGILPRLLPAPPVSESLWGGQQRPGWRDKATAGSRPGLAHWLPAPTGAARDAG